MRAQSKQRALSAAKAIIVVVIAAVILACFFIGISNLQGGADDEGREQLEDSIRRTAAACYAAEGIYPPSIDYMKEKYGLQIDENRYYVDYIVFAENLMPDFTILDADKVKPQAGSSAQSGGFPTGGSSSSGGQSNASQSSASLSSGSQSGGSQAGSSQSSSSEVS